MLIEFGNYLKFIWADSVLKAGIASGAESIAVDRIFTLNQIELPSKAFDSHAASPICFKLSKELGVSAEVLADSFVSGGNALFGSRCEFFTGGRGYLNCKFRQPLLSEFIENFCGVRVEQFLSGVAVTGREVLLQQQSPFCDLRIPSSTDSLDRLLEAGDPEVDPGVSYLTWYSSKFKHDLRRLQEIIGTARPISEIAAAEWSDHRLLAPMVESTRNFRYLFLSKLSTGRPELAVVACRDLINSFYSVFNHPSVRNSSALGFDKAGFEKFGEFSRAYGELVAQALQLASGTISR